MNAATLNTLPVSTTTTTTTAQASTGVAGGPRLLLRLEGAALLAGSVAAYVALGGGWLFFVALILVPDLSLLGYVAGPRVGAAVYNSVHSTLGPIVLGALALVLGSPTTLLVATIWLAHVGMDRAAGYGLKYASAFGDTHLGHAHLRFGA